MRIILINWYFFSKQTFTLEKLDSSLNLTHEGKSRSKARVPSASRELLLVHEPTKFTFADYGTEFPPVYSTY